jgi:hypothetical protein
MLQLSPAEIAEHRIKGTCFRCNKKYTPGHRKECKQLFVIEVLSDDYKQEEESLTDPTISLHALTGIQPRSARTMQVVVLVAGAPLTALLDSGSTHNFIDTDTVQRIEVHLQGRSGLRVAVANGDRLTSPGSYADLQITVGEEDFHIDCYGLSLGSYDMLLGV